MDPKEKRRLLDENRQKERQRKARTRNLIQMGGVAASFGFERPEDLEELRIPRQPRERPRAAKGARS